MATAWVLASKEYDEINILGVFSTKERAEEVKSAADRADPRLVHEIAEWEVDRDYYFGTGEGDS